MPLWLEKLSLPKLESISEELLISLAVLGIVNIIKALYDKISEISYRRLLSFSISGYWIASFQTTGASGKNNIEIVRLSQRKEYVEARIQQHSNLNRKKTKHFNAVGYFRTNELYLSYIEISKDSGGGGIIALRLGIDVVRLPILTGEYLEIDRSSTNYQHISGPYSLKKIHLNYMHKIRFFFKRPVFNTLEKAETFYKLQSDWKNN